MADPKLERTCVQINYTADDGYKSQCGYRSGKGSPINGDATKPEDALLAGLEELARLAALFGFEDEARKATEGAFARVADWRAKRVA